MLFSYNASSKEFGTQGRERGGNRGVLGQGVDHAQVGVQATTSQQADRVGHSNQLHVPSIEVSNMFSALNANKSL